MESLSSFIGIDGTNATPNSGRIQINLKPRDQRKSGATEIILRLQPELRCCKLTQANGFLRLAAGRDSDAEVRQGIVAAIGEWGGGAASPWIRERLVEDPSPGVRTEAAYRLGMLSDPEVRSALNQDDRG